MALALNFDLTFSNDGTIMYIDDTTGIYDGGNLGGWGTPNPAANDVALVAYIRFQPYTGSEVNLSHTLVSGESVVQKSTSTAKQFIKNYYKDGYLKITLVAVPVYADIDAAEYITANNVYYSSDSSSLKYYNGTTVAAIAESNWASLLTSSYTQTSKEYLNTILLDGEYNLLTESYTAGITNGDNVAAIEANMVQLKFLIQSAAYRFASSKQLEAQRMIENLTKQFA